MLSINYKKIKEIILKDALRTIEYLKCRADLSVEIDFGPNGNIGMDAPGGILFYSINIKKIIYNIFFLKS